jgi:hypothetical protein
LISIHGKEFFRKGTQSFFGIKEGKSQGIMEILTIYGQVHTSYRVQLERIRFISTNWMVRSWPFQSTANSSSFFSQRSSDAHGGIYCIILFNPYPLYIMLCLFYTLFTTFCTICTSILNFFVVLYVLVYYH